MLWSPANSYNEVICLNAVEVDVREGQQCLTIKSLGEKQGSVVSIFILKLFPTEIITHGACASLNPFTNQTC